MMNRAALASLTTALLSLAATSAFADDDQAPGAVAPVTTTTAGTLVVVTPNAPVIVTNGQVAGAPASVATAIAPPGAAEMPPAPPAPAAPQNEDWNNVSHINGSIVPVGERNQYLYAYKKNNLQSNPIAWMFGYYQIAGSHALSQNIAASLEISGWSTEHGNESGYQIAPTLQVYFKRTFSGPFLEGGLVIHHDDNGGYAYDCFDCSTTSMTRDWMGPEVMFGWAWMFDSGLNISAAFGAAKRMQDTQASNEYSSDDPEPVGYFRVGYAF
jgi:hypothetical protein